MMTNLTLPMIPIRGVVLYPNMCIQIKIGRDLSIMSMKESITKDGLVFITTQYDEKLMNPNANQLYQTGVTASIIGHNELHNNEFKVQIFAHERARANTIDKFTFWKVNLNVISDEYSEDMEIEMIHAHLRNILNEYQVLRIQKKSRN